jgi:hypothetical protein
MIYGLGNALYRFGCAAAAIVAIVGVLAAVGEKSRGAAVIVFAFFVGFAVMAWLAGRACRYVLAGR